MDNCIKTIKIKFVDFYEPFDHTNNFVWKFLENSPKYKPELSDDPDYVVYSVFGDKHLDYDCVKIFFTGEDQSPDFNLCDYAMGFDHINFKDRYLRLPLYFLYSEHYKLMSEKHLNDFQKDEFCSFVYSNGRATSVREELFNKVSEYKQVNSGGRYKNNVGGPVPDKLEFEKKHKFALAVENVSHDGYTTEKLIQSFAAGCIPIYYGDPGILNEFNEEAFINVRSYETIDQVIDKIKEIDQNDELYTKMLRTPALVNPNAYSDMMASVDEFLDNIFESSKENAYRRSLECYNKNYVNLQRAKTKAYRFLSKVKNFPKRLLRRK